MAERRFPIPLEDFKAKIKSAYDQSVQNTQYPEGFDPVKFVFEDNNEEVYVKNNMVYFEINLISCFSQNLDVMDYYYGSDDAKQEVQKKFVISTWPEFKCTEFYQIFMDELFGYDTKLDDNIAIKFEDLKELYNALHPDKSFDEEHRKIFGEYAEAHKNLVSSD
jgi:hypothetical protein